MINDKELSILEEGSNRAEYNNKNKINSTNVT